MNENIDQCVLHFLSYGARMWTLGRPELQKSRSAGHIKGYVMSYQTDEIRNETILWKTRSLMAQTISKL